MQRHDSTFSTATTMVPNGDENEHIQNRKADINSSLFRSCRALKDRLKEVPGFEPFLQEMEEDETDAVDPVTSMWNLLRRGYPLMAIYNALQPAVPLEVDVKKLSEAKIGKAATFKFLAACLEHLGFPPNECFLIVDLYGQDTTGFVKVLRVINRVLDILGQKGILMSRDIAVDDSKSDSLHSKSYEQQVIDEMVTSELDYVQHLETLQHFKNQLEQSGAIPGDVVHDIFMNLNALLDFQRRFLIRIEQQYAEPFEHQNWGLLFVQYQDGFRVYETFIANQTRGLEIVTKEWDKIAGAPLSASVKGMVDSPAVLGGFLMKPFQRLTKYPQLLSAMHKKGGFSEDKVRDLEAGAMASIAILERANAAADKETRLTAVDELAGSVDDWKGHKLQQFGELLLFGTQTVVKNDGQKDMIREYRVYLFERILLCCKDMTPGKPKNRLGVKSIAKPGKLRLQLKGRIFMQNVTDVMAYVNSGNFCLQIFWKGDPGVENFVIRFQTEDVRNKWQRLVIQQRRVLNETHVSGPRGTSNSHFTSLQDHSLINPYEEDEGGDDDDDRPTSRAHMHGDWDPSRNMSSTSLRSRSTTGSSGSNLPGRVASSRYTAPEPPPLQTSAPNPAMVALVDDRIQASYFSPTMDSPLSTRSSSQAGAYPFPRQQSTMNGWPAEGNKHNTAPPIGRTPRGDEGNGAHGYPMGVPSQRTSPPGARASQNGHIMPNIPSRLRSVSSPDIQVPGVKRYPNGQAVPEDVPVPPIPPHMASMRAPVNRSQNNSPTDLQQQQQRSVRNTTQVYPVVRNGSHYAPEPAWQMEPHRHYSHQAPAMIPMEPASAPATENPFISQLKVKIWYEPRPSHVTIVVPMIIKHRSLIDRIDSKMSKNTRCSIAKGSARLRYMDKDQDLITIKNDEDVQMAVEEWMQSNEELLRKNVVPDFELYWHEIS